VPEWSAAYINYKGLKRLIKAAVVTFKAGGDADLAGKPTMNINYIQ
jgi:glycerophosphodiester phosphodiesterase